MSSVGLFSGPVCQRLTRVLLHVLWQGFAVVAAVWAVLCLLRPSRATTQIWPPAELHGLLGRMRLRLPGPLSASREPRTNW